MKKGSNKLIYSNREAYNEIMPEGWKKSSDPIITVDVDARESVESTDVSNCDKPVTYQLIWKESLLNNI